MPPRDPRSLLRSFGKDRRGGFAVMAGTFMPVALILAAFAVDQGSLYVDRRNLQSLNDIAAITAAANINNATNAAVLVVQDNETSNVSVSSAGSVYNAAAHDTRQVDLTVERGRYTGKSNIAVASRFQLPLYIEIAHAEGRLTDVSCPTGRPESLSVSIAARPGIATLHVGRIDETQLKNFSVAPVPDWARIATLKLLGLDLLSVQGKATVAIQNISETTLTFNKAEIDAKAVKTVSTQNILQPLTQSLLNTLQVRLVVVGILPLGFVEPSLTTVKSTLVGLLTPIASPVDALLYSTLSTLGVRVGEADVRIHGATCGRSVLVQ